MQKIDKDIIGDRPSVWTNQILLNIYQQTQDGLYKNIREKKFLLSPEEQILMQYLSSLLNYSKSYKKRIYLLHYLLKVYWHKYYFYF